MDYSKHQKVIEMFNEKDGRLEGLGEWKKFPLFWFLLFLSYKCTRRCSYCYTFNQGVNSVMEMDDRTFDRLLDWIPEVWEKNGVKVNTIVFLGGEPLLRTDRIKKVMDVANEKTKGVLGNIFSNSDLVDTVNWDDLERLLWWNTNITDISIPELARRMKVIGERSNVLNQTIVATLDDYNLERLEDITRFGVENGYRLRYYRNLFRGNDEEYKDRLLRKMHIICDLLEGYVIKGYDIHTTFLLDTLIPKWDFESSPYHCGKRIATVYPDGTVGPCLRNHTYKTGTIWDENPMDAVRCEDFHMDIRRPDLPEECHVCEVRETCQGGCPNDRLIATGTVSGKSLMCRVHREIIPRLRDLDFLKDNDPGTRGI